VDKQENIDVVIFSFVVVARLKAGRFSYGAVNYERRLHRCSAAGDSGAGGGHGVSDTRRLLRRRVRGLLPKYRVQLLLPVQFPGTRTTTRRCSVAIIENSSSASITDTSTATAGFQRPLVTILNPLMHCQTMTNSLTRAYTGHPTGSTKGEGTVATNRFRIRPRVLWKSGAKWSEVGIVILVRHW